MTLHKICKSIDMSSDEWRKYCLWRKIDFKTFDSIDSTRHNSIFHVARGNDDWKFAVTNAGYLTDVVNAFEFAKSYGQRYGANEILNFDYAEDEDSTKQVIGYDILDGPFHFSFLTNFQNDTAIVNDCIGENGLVQYKEQALRIHKWFIDNMGDDHHVIGSRIFAIYKTTILNHL